MKSPKYHYVSFLWASISSLVKICCREKGQKSKRRYRMTAILFLTTNYLTDRVIWAGTLSWSTNGSPYHHFSRHWWQTSSSRHHSTVMHNPWATFSPPKKKKKKSTWYINKYNKMHMFNVAQFRCQHCIKVYKMSAHLHSDIIRWISVGLFLPEELLAHVTALWQFFVLFYLHLSPVSCDLRTRTGKN